MSLSKKILSELRSSRSVTQMKQLYLKFPGVAKPTIRARVYENVGKGITKVDKGLYISSEAIIEQGNTLEIINRMLQEGDKFDFVFLDIPYQAHGQGNPGSHRNLFDKPTITPEQFGDFIVKAESLLKTNDSPVAFMFTSGTSSKKAHDNYFKQFERTGLKLCKEVGTYTKLWSNGKRRNIGIHPMPVENIYFFSRSGKVNIKELDFTLVAPLRKYPSEKPYEMIKSLVEQLTEVGQWVFDGFGGSGKILKACIELNRKCHIIDIDNVAINNHILKL